MSRDMTPGVRKRRTALIPASSFGATRAWRPERGSRAWPGVPNRRRAHCARSAFTLLEMLILVAILASVTALAWPSFERLQMEYRLRQAGQLVQARLSGARVRAIDTGFEYQFLYEPGGQRFLILPHDAHALASLATAASGAAGNAPAGATRPPPRVAGRLPSPQAHFDPAAIAGLPGETVPPEWLAGVHDAGDFSGVAWSAPLVFRPDGTAQAGQIIIRDKKSHFVTIGVRALTGAVSVSPIENGAMTR